MFSLSLQDKKFLSIFSILVVLYIFPFIHSDFFYSDDWCRAYNPLYTWMWDGRLLTEGLYRLLGFGSIINYFPLYHIMIMGLLLYTGYLVYKLLFFDYSPLVACFFTFIIVMNPFYLEEISFQYDSLSMTLSILLGIWASKELFANKRVLLPTLSLTGVLLLYQPNIIFVTSIILIKIFFSFLEGKDLSFGFFVKILLVFFLSLCVYYIGLSFISVERAHSRYSLSISSLWGARSIVYHYKGSLLCGIPLYGLYMFMIIKYIRKHNYKLRALSIFIMLSFPLLLVVNAVIPFIILSNPSVVPRVFIGFASIIFFFVWVGFFSLKKVSKKASYGFLIVVGLYFIEIDYAYNQVHKFQKDFSNKVSLLLMADLSKLKGPPIKNLVVLGKDPVSPLSEEILKKYPYFKHYNVLKQGISSSSWRTKCYLKTFPFFQFKTIENKIPLQGEVPSKIYAENPIYILKIGKDTAILEFKERNNEKN